VVLAGRQQGWHPHPETSGQDDSSGACRTIVGVAPTSRNFGTGRQQGWHPHPEASGLGVIIASNIIITIGSRINKTIF